MNGQLINHFLVSTLPGPGNPKESNLNLHHVCRDPFPNVKNLELIALDLHFPAHLKYLTWLAATLEFNSHTRCCVPSITLGGLFSFLSRLAEAVHRYQGDSTADLGECVPYHCLISLVPRSTRP